VNVPPKYTFLVPVPATEYTTAVATTPFPREAALVPFHLATYLYGEVLKSPAIKTFVLFTAYTEVTLAELQPLVIAVLTQPVPASVIRCNPVLDPTNTTVGDTTEILLISPNE
jgi:hypothetical protein